MKHTTMLVSAVLASAALTAPALTTLDSSQFTYKYEMDVRPDQQDLDAGGAKDFTGWNDNFFTLGEGAMTIDASSNGKNLISNQDVGANGDIWRALGASSSDGFTVEARVKVIACTGANGAICIEAGPSDSKVYARLNLFGDKIGWNGTTLTNLDTSVWHTYRIAREGGKAVHAVWVDDVLVASNLGTGFTYDNATLYRMLLGSPGGGWTGKAQIDYLRFTKGAYAPVMTPKASTDFPVLYEMADTDDRISATATSGEWKIGGSGATITKTNGRLSVTMTSKVQAYWDALDAIWKDYVTADTPYTVEFKVRIKDSLVDGDRTMVFLTGAKSGPVGQIYIGANSTQWQLTSTMSDNQKLSEEDNTDKMHVFRIAYSGVGRNAFTVWRDGVKLGEGLADCAPYYAYSGNALAIARFGVSSSGNNATHGGSFVLDYIRWDIGNVWDWKESYTPFTMVIR